jgi:riboflavin transporter
MRRKNGEILTRLTTIAVLSALGFLLMAFARFPYPIAPWLMIEVSDLVVLIAYALYGFTGGIITAILKTLLDFAINGLSGFMGIGNITALITSLMYVFGLFLCSRVFHLFKKGLPFRILGYLFITILVSIVMTLLNVLFITPTYLKGEFATCFDSETVSNIITTFQDMGIKANGYLGCIVIVYLPFNLMKGALICLIYEILFNRLIFVLMTNSPFMRKYFLGPITKNENSTKKDKEKENIKYNSKEMEE